MPSENFMDMIRNQFGNFDKFREEYIKFAATLFGSGWSWLVKKDNKLSFINTSNAETPIGTEIRPLCVVDLWEHAYYIDYRNNRADYLSQIIINCINWQFCESMLEK